MHLHSDATKGEERTDGVLQLLVFPGSAFLLRFFQQENEELQL